MIEDKFNKFLAHNLLMGNVKANSESLRKIELEVPGVADKDHLEDEENILPLTSDEIRFKSLRRLNEENEKRFRRNR